jgi:ribosomal protein S18 acetylase RimI-like enzyme
MAVTIMRQESGATWTDLAEGHESCKIGEINKRHTGEALEFLAANPVHTVFMASLIRDNGITSPQNRGTFYGCRNRGGQLEAVALIGHATLIEARTKCSLASFARMTGNCLNVRLIRGERKTIDSFWNHYRTDGQKPRMVCNELLLEQRKPLSEIEPVHELRPATLKELAQVMNVNASMAFEEGGSNPLQKDPQGFRGRVARRIEQGRVWALVQDGELIFKADILAETPLATYLEGIHVHPDRRSKGHGLRCLTQLARTLLARSQSICLTLSQKNRQALAFYSKAGYEFNSHYETIYLR